MAVAELVADIAIILGAGIDILDHQRNWRSGRHLFREAVVLEHARQDANRIGFLALADEFGLARLAAIEIDLDVAFGERNARWTAVDHAADGRAMALAEGCDTEQMAEAVV